MSLSTQHIMTTLPRLRSANPAANITGFFKLVNAAMETYIKLNGGLDGIAPVLTESSPKERLEQTDNPFELIVFRVIEARMAPTDNAGTRIPRSVTTREVRPDPNKLNYSIIEAAWWEEVIVSFDVLSKSNSNANKLVEWFHKFIYVWANVTKVFETHGISQFRFEKRGPDRRVDGINDEELYSRELVYSFRIENLVRFEKRQLTDITLNVDFPAGSPPINLTSDSQ